MGLVRRVLWQRRQDLRYLIDAFVEDTETLQILRHIDVVQQGGPGSFAHKDPALPQNRARQTFLQGRQSSDRYLAFGWANGLLRCSYQTAIQNRSA